MVYILVGIPCSGKSTWRRKIIKNHLFKGKNVPRIISRDDVRQELFGDDYDHNIQSEIQVTIITQKQLKQYLTEKHETIIVDNTHCKEGYIDNLIRDIEYLSNDEKIQIIFFDTNLILAYYRNIKRYFQNGKWIPFKIINHMKKNYDKIQRQKYAKYI